MTNVFDVFAADAYVDSSGVPCAVPFFPAGYVVPLRSAPASFHDVFPYGGGSFLPVSI